MTLAMVIDTHMLEIQQNIEKDAFILVQISKFK